MFDKNQISISTFKLVFCKFLIIASINPCSIHTKTNNIKKNYLLLVVDYICKKVKSLMSKKTA